MEDKTINKYLYLISVGLIILLTLPVLIQDGMFMDAVQYSAISNNLHKGIGSFWALQFDVHNIIGLPAFSEQPPLGFGIQSLFFDLLGSSMYTERIYTAFCLGITAIIIIAVWRKINDSSGYKQAGWLPLIFWITIPIVFWSFRNNMLENTMGIFTLLSIFFLYQSLTESRFVLNTLIASVFIFLASFTKGLPGLFPIAFPLICFVIFKDYRFKKLFLQSIILITIPVLIYFILLQTDAAKNSLQTYFFERLLNRVSDDTNAVNPFFTIKVLAQQLFIPIILTAIILLPRKFKFHITTHRKQVQTAILFFCVGLSASVPLILTPVQKPFYLSTSMPYFAISFSILVAPFLYPQILRLVKSKFLRPIAITFFIASIVITMLNIGKTDRDKPVIEDVNALGGFLPEQQLVQVSTEIYYDWIFQSYLIRKYNIILDYEGNDEYILVEKNQARPRGEYEKQNLRLSKYTIYKKKEEIFL